MGGYENEGGFPAPDGFQSKASPQKGIIQDTCNPCGFAIRQEVREAVKRAIENLRKG